VESKNGLGIFLILCVRSAGKERSHACGVIRMTGDALQPFVINLSGFNAGTLVKSQSVKIRRSDGGKLNIMNRF
jgi:hypothetical protein